MPFWHGQELFLACQTRWRARPFWVHGAGHNNVELLLRDIEVLLERHLRQCHRLFLRLDEDADADTANHVA